MSSKPISKKTGTFRSFDGTKIYFEVRGEGDPLVLVYGIGCVMNHWVHQTKFFSKTHQVILFDYRAHHHSQVPANPDALTLDDLAKDLLFLLDHLEIPKAHFAGHSFGVQTLVRLYGMAPDRFSSLTFINGFVRNPLAGMFGSDLASRFFEYFRSGYELMPETLTALWKMAVQNPLSVQLSALAGGFNLSLTALKDIQIYARGVATLDLSSFIKMFENMMHYDGTDVLGQIQIPTLVISGNRDSVTPVAIQEEIHRKIEKSQFLVVPYGSHCTQLDMPDLVNLRMNQFFEEISKASSL